MDKDVVNAGIELSNVLVTLHEIKLHERKAEEDVADRRLNGGWRELRCRGCDEQ